VWKALLHATAFISLAVMAIRPCLQGHVQLKLPLGQHCKKHKPHMVVQHVSDYLLHTSCMYMLLFITAFVYKLSASCTVTVNVTSDGASVARQACGCA
jgi:hypothetical protein